MGTGGNVEPVAVVLGRRIRKLRERAGLTQTELAKLVLSSKSAISEYELGNRPPDVKLDQRLEEVLDAGGQLIELWHLLELGEQDSATVADVERDALALTGTCAPYLGCCRHRSTRGRTWLPREFLQKSSTVSCRYARRDRRCSAAS